GGELADVAFRTRHLVEATAGAAAAAAAFLLFDLLRAHLEATLAERDNQLVRRLGIAGRRPVVTTLSTRAALDPHAELLFQDVGAIRRAPGLRIEALPHVLENRLL